MNFEHTTDRLTLRVLTAADAEKTLRFYQENRQIFEKYEPLEGDSFFTLSHQQTLLNYEYQLILKRQMIRFWIFKKEDPSQIIGTISFHHIMPKIYASAQVGYKMDHHFWQKGYCYEALTTAMKLVAADLKIHRFEALVLPDNLPSIRLLEKAGFEQEGLLRDKVLLQNVWRDHFLYTRIMSSPASDDSLNND